MTTRFTRGWAARRTAPGAEGTGRGQVAPGFLKTPASGALVVLLATLTSSCGVVGNPDAGDALLLARLLNSQTDAATKIQADEMRIANNLVLTLDAGSSNGENFLVVRSDFAEAIATLRRLQADQIKLADTVKHASYAPELVNLVQRDAIDAYMENVTREASWMTLADNVLRKSDIAVKLLAEQLDLTRGENEPAGEWVKRVMRKVGEEIGAEEAKAIAARANQKQNPLAMLMSQEKPMTSRGVMLGGLAENARKYVPEIAILRESVGTYLAKSRTPPMVDQLETLKTEYGLQNEEIDQK